MTKNTKTRDGWRQNQWRIRFWAVAAVFLLAPFLAMQFTNQVNWDVADFVIFGALIAGVGIAFELTAGMRSKPTVYRTAVAVALATAFILLWVNGAVGIIGSENNKANLVYLGVLAVGLIGVIIARFRPRGMARAMFATALAQLLFTLIALIAAGPIWPLDTLALNGFFAAPWLLSAWLFGKSG